MTLRNWLKEEKARGVSARAGCLVMSATSCARLRDENAKLRMEREILRKAAVFFAREDDGR